METRNENSSILAAGRKNRHSQKSSWDRSFTSFVFFCKACSALREVKKCNGRCDPDLLDDRQAVQSFSKWKLFCGGRLSREASPKTATQDENVSAAKAVVEEGGRATLEKLKELLGVDATSL